MLRDVGVAVAEASTPTRQTATDQAETRTYPAAASPTAVGEAKEEGPMIMPDFPPPERQNSGCALIGSVLVAVAAVALLVIVVSAVAASR